MAQVEIAGLDAVEIGRVIVDMSASDDVDRPAGVMGRDRHVIGLGERGDLLELVMPPVHGRRA